MSASPTTAGPALPAPALGPAVAVAALLLLAAVLRCWGLGDHALWHDELVSLTRSEGHRVFPRPELGVALPFIPLQAVPDEGALAVLTQSRDISPPSYFLVLRGWRWLFGSGPAALRSLSVLASVVTVLAGARLAAALAGRRAGLVTGLLLALSPLEWRYAQEVRPYAVLCALATVSTLALLGLLSGRGRRRLLWTVYLLTTAGLLATHYTGAVVPLVHLAWCLYTVRPTLARLPRAAVLAGLVVVALAGWMLAHQKVVARVEGLLTRDFLAVPGATPAQDWLAARAEVPYNMLAFGGGFISGLQSSPLKAAPHALLVAVLILLGLRGGRQTWLVFMLALAGPLALVAVDLALGSRALQVPRYAIVSSPFVWIAAGIGLARLRGWPFAVALLLVAAGEVDGTVRARYRDTLADELTVVADKMNADACDERDLVISLLTFPEQILELNQFLEGRPAELVVGSDGRVDEASLQRPWRHVFVLEAPGRAEQAEAIEARLEESFERRQSLDLPKLGWSWFASGTSPSLPPSPR